MEWEVMADVPEDFPECWCALPVPLGAKRCLVISAKGKQSDSVGIFINFLLITNIYYRSNNCKTAKWKRFKSFSFCVALWIKRQRNQKQSFPLLYS